MMIQINFLQDIPFQPDTDLLLKRVRLKPSSPDTADFLTLLKQSILTAQPKAVYRVCEIEERTEDTILIDGVIFCSRTLALNLSQAERVFVYVATCGLELDSLPISSGDFVSQFWLDAIKAESLYSAIHYLHSTLEARYALGKTSSMSPGSGDISIWPIEQQQLLFTLLEDGPQQIGVKLTESCLMLPNKTVSGFYFPTEKAIRTCQVCKRENCPSRQAVFDLEAWEAVQQPSLHGL